MYLRRIVDAVTLSSSWSTSSANLDVLSARFCILTDNRPTSATNSPNSASQLKASAPMFRNKATRAALYRSESISVASLDCNSKDVFTNGIAPVCSERRLKIGYTATKAKHVTTSQLCKIGKPSRKCRLVYMHIHCTSNHE